MRTPVRMVQNSNEEQEFDEALSHLISNFQTAISQKQATTLLPNLIIYDRKDPNTQKRDVHQIQWDEEATEEEAIAAIALEAYKRKVEIAFVFMFHLGRAKTGDIRPGENIVDKVAQNTEERECVVISGITLNKKTNAGIIFVGRDERQRLFLNSPEIVFCGCNEESLLRPFLLEAFIDAFIDLSEV